jgi:hypothetical protein
MASQTMPFENVDWRAVTAALKTDKSTQLEMRLRKLEQKSARHVISIEEADPLNQTLPTAPSRQSR